MNAMQVAQVAANSQFDTYLDSTRSTATSSVPPAVERAAKEAYSAAGGKRPIVVCGRGNITHPVCSVYVRYRRQTDH